MNIKELPDFQFDWDIAYKDNNLDLLEYVTTVANKFNPSFDGVDFSPSEDTMTFNNRYIESKLDLRGRYDRMCSLGYFKDYSFDDYSKNSSKSNSLDTSFLDRYSDSQLQNTISAYGLDANKLWYLILYVNDYVKGIGVNAIGASEPLIDKLNELYDKLGTATAIILEKDGRKCFSSDRREVISILHTAMKHLIHDYNNIIESECDNYKERLKQIGLNGVIQNTSILNTHESVNIDISYRQYKFAEMLLYFLKDRKGTNPPNVKEKVYKEKHFFVSMLIYVVGLYNEDDDTAKMKWYEPYYNDKDNRNLSNLVRNYKNRQFPNTVSRIYNK